jgi:ribosome-binding factor A
MKHHRIERINSLLKEVIFEVIHREVKNPHVTGFVTVTRVETSLDLSFAKVYISMVASEADKQKTLEALQSAAGFIAVNAAKKLDRLRFFPSLQFKLDRGADNSSRIEEILSKIQQDKK